MNPQVITEDSVMILIQIRHLPEWDDMIQIQTIHPCGENGMTLALTSHLSEESDMILILTNRQQGGKGTIQTLTSHQSELENQPVINQDILKALVSLANQVK